MRISKTRHQDADSSEPLTFGGSSRDQPSVLCGNDNASGTGWAVEDLLWDHRVLPFAPCRQWFPRRPRPWRRAHCPLSPTRARPAPNPPELQLVGPFLSQVSSSRGGRHGLGAPTVHIKPVEKRVALCYRTENCGHALRAALRPQLQTLHLLELLGVGGRAAQPGEGRHVLRLNHRSRASHPPSPRHVGCLGRPL